MVQARYRYIRGKRVRVNPDGTVPTQNAQASGKAPPTELAGERPYSPDKTGQGQGAPKTPTNAGNVVTANAKTALAFEKLAQDALARGDSAAALRFKKTARRIKERTVGLSKGGTVKKEKKAKKAPDSLTKPPRTMAKGGTMMHKMPDGTMMKDSAMKKGRSFGRPPFKFNGPSR